MILQTLDWAYEKAVSGAPGIDSAGELAKNYTREDGSLTKQVNTLIRWQNTKAGSSGFITGLGGFATLPIAIPANLVSVVYIQIRMIAAIALMGGYDLRDDRVKSLVYLCLAGNMAKEILQDIGITLGKRITAQIIGNISEKTIITINRRIGLELLSKTGSRGVINLGKAIPVAGGIISGSFDVFTTNLVGNMARNVFIAKD